MELKHNCYLTQLNMQVTSDKDVKDRAWKLEDGTTELVGWAGIRAHSELIGVLCSASIFPSEIDTGGDPDPGVLGRVKTSSGSGVGLVTGD